MNKHALTILSAAESWDWPVLTGMRDSEGHEQANKFKTASRRLLSGFLTESQILGGTLTNQFWSTVEQCHPKLTDNIEELTHTALLDQSELELLLFDDIEPQEINFGPVFELAAGLFMHLGISFMNPNGHMYVSCEAGMDDGEEEEALKLLVLKRDGTLCPVTGRPFFGCVLTHVVPTCTLEKDILDCISIFAGDEVRDIILQNAHDIGNIFNIELSAAIAYNHGEWGIEALQLEDGNDGVKYIFRKTVPEQEFMCSSISLQDGDEIIFGGGPDGEMLEAGPHPFLCNLHLAVVRVLAMSGAAEIISQLMLDADDKDFLHVCVSDDKDFVDVLDAKLLISGRAII